MTLRTSPRNKSHDFLRTYGIYIFLCFQVVFYCVLVGHTSCSIARPNIYEAKTQSLAVRNDTQNEQLTAPQHILANDFSSNTQDIPSPVIVNNTGNLRSNKAQEIPATQAPTITNIPTIEVSPPDNNATNTALTTINATSLRSGYGPVQDVWNNHNTSKFAYVFYVTDDNYACSALINAYRLRHEVNMDQTIDIVFLVLRTKKFSATFYESVKSLSIQLKIVDGVDIMLGSNYYYADCMVKLRVFELEEYKRIVFFDSDIMIIKNMDHLFYLPSTLIAAPRAWWIAQPFFTSILLVIEPSKEVFQKRILDRYRKDQEDHISNLYDMDLLNREFQNEVMYLPGYYGALDSLYVEDWSKFKFKRGAGFVRKYTQEEAIPLMYYLHMTDGAKWWEKDEEDLEHALPFLKELFECGGAYVERYVVGR